ncbi:hypothetical protein [Methylobacillus glycogenes]|uniref:hypothetical protein n=1 Tax=Methylobacillus glycogenes TaxID=406 RepID=UPI0004708998|nr:hypothetical protein [Methylobacillus glycogenes]
MPKLHLHKLRIYILLLLAVFLADIVSANASLHLPATQPGSPLAMQHQGMHHESMDHESMHHGLQHQHDAAAQDASPENTTDHTQQHAGKCGSCHDCLSCFSVLPVALSQAAAALPQRHQAASVHSIYYPPAIAQLQRPPILSRA